MYNDSMVFRDVTIGENSYGYYLIINLQYSYCDSATIFHDSQIIKFLGLTLSEYIDLLKPFNVFENDAGLFFEFLDDADNAKNWLNENMVSLLVMKKLI